MYLYRFNQCGLVIGFRNRLTQILLVLLTGILDFTVDMFFDIYFSRIF